MKDTHTNTVSTNDTWHASKNVAKEIRAVCTGARYLEGKTWHPQLSDKAASIKTHTFWAMKNCDENPETLRASISNITDHYKDNHSKCHPTSRCKLDDAYEPSKVIITDPIAERLLRHALEKTIVYKSAQDYVHCMDTYFVESFNNTMLQYHDKRVGSLGDTLYKFKTQLSVLDWNDHIGSRRATSSRAVTEATNPRRRSEKTLLERKTYQFWGDVWQKYTAAVGIMD